MLLLQLARLGEHAAGQKLDASAMDRDTLLV
jgi:hypothetical protein